MLGGGGHGTVFKGTWKGMEVAVKKCMEPNPKDVAILTCLGIHPNIVHMYGVLFKETDLQCLIVTELVKEGSLFDYIHKEKQVPSSEQRFYWKKDIACGMEFLHHNGIIHRDLKSGNVLLGERMIAKLCDFGTARKLDHTTAQTRPTGTYRWMAPEVAKEDRARISQKCDVYSYGMVLYELVSLQLPFKDDQEMMAIFSAFQGKRPSLPESDSECQPFLRRLITACWDEDPKARPTFQEIIHALERKAFPL